MNKEDKGGMTDARKIGWILGFAMGANWEMTPMDEREYDILGNCINETRSIKPSDEDFQDPIKAFEEKFNLNFNDK